MIWETQSDSFVATQNSHVNVGGKLAWVILLFLVKVELTWVQELGSSLRLHGDF
jgi:hypothetical protein